MKMPGAVPPTRTLAKKIDHLFRTIHPVDQGEYSYAEVASAINERGGPTISAAYVWQLRKGLRDNPTKKHLEALANFFGVSPIYFFDDDAASRIDSELELLVALRDSSVRRIALRATGLSPEFLSSVADMILRARQIAGLPKIDDEPHLETEQGEGKKPSESETDSSS
jgi:transcriptional regulator with XRE-family HTH domain